MSGRSERGVTPNANAEMPYRLDIERAYLQWHRATTDQGIWHPTWANPSTDLERLAFSAGWQAALNGLGMFTEAR